MIDRDDRIVQYSTLRFVQYVTLELYSTVHYVTLELYSTVHYVTLELYSTVRYVFIIDDGSHMKIKLFHVLSSSMFTFPFHPFSVVYSNLH